jgi:hypothetical protein
MTHSTEAAHRGNELIDEASHGYEKYSKQAAAAFARRFHQSGRAKKQEEHGAQVHHALDRQRRVPATAAKRVVDNTVCAGLTCASIERAFLCSK